MLRWTCVTCSAGARTPNVVGCGIIVGRERHYLVLVVVAISVGDFPAHPGRWDPLNEHSRTEKRPRSRRFQDADRQAVWSSRHDMSQEGRVPLSIRRVLLDDYRLPHFESLLWMSCHIPTAWCAGIKPLVQSQVPDWSCRILTCGARPPLERLQEKVRPHAILGVVTRHAEASRVGDPRGGLNAG